MITIYPFGFYELFDILKEEELYEKTYKGSFLKHYYDLGKEHFKDQKISVITFSLNEKIVGILTFNHTVYERKFVFRGEKIFSKQLGSLMVYVKPEYRNKGICKELFLALEPFLEEQISKEESEKYIINIVAQQAALDISLKYIKKIFVMNQSNVDCLKNNMRFKQIKPHICHNNQLFLF